MDKTSILIIDDDPGSVNTLIDFLNSSGFETLIAPSGERALRHLGLIQPDLILLDVLMPGIDGFETCRRLKQLHALKDIPVIFMSAMSETVEKLKGFEAGGVDFLTKPVQHEEVLARVNAHLSIRTLQQQLQEQTMLLEGQNVLLEKQNERFRRLAEATFEGIIIHKEGCIIDVNEAAVKMFGLPADELIAKQIAELIPSRILQAAVESSSTLRKESFRAEGIRSDASVFPIEVQIRSMPYQEHDVLVSAIRDLSLRQKMEEERSLLQRENSSLRSGMKDRYKFGEIIGKTPIMQELYQTIVRASASDANVVIGGESGTGKELVARTIHQQSERKNRAFVVVNCGAVPEPLFEREFFGHRKGAFTGATMDKPGYFDRAHRGTLFLDEVGELTLTMQVKLLRALQEKEYTPLGDTTNKTADVRIVAATNKDLREQLQKGLIREDFFYRIRVIVMTLPPLRDRRADIPLLIEHILQQHQKTQEGLSVPARILEALCSYHWPGNIRELQNELQRYLAGQELEFIGNQSHGSDSGCGSLRLEGLSPGLNFREALEVFEKEYLCRMLERNGGRRGTTAKMLDMPLRTFQRKIKKYGLI